MTRVIHTPLETGWLPTTPVEDTVLRRFLHNQAEVNEALAGSLGGRLDRTDDVFLVDAACPVSYFNQAILARPLDSAGDPVLDVVDRFFAGAHHGATILSIWPTPNLAARGWSLVGHPVAVLRSPGPLDHPTPDGIEVRLTATAADLAAAERVAVEGYPLEPARGLPPGSLFTTKLGDAGVRVRVAQIDGDPAAVGLSHVAHDLVNLCFAATLPAARRRGAWAALVGARIADAPALAAIAYTSDHSRPGFVAMGFLPVTRFTLWERPA
jgi:hypothetical protein